MKDLLRAGQQWLADKLSEFASREVIYQRDVTQFPVTATIGKTEAEQDSGDGLILRVEIRDFLIDTQSLAIDGAPILPERGDRILETEAGQTFTYEVLPIGSQRAWRYSDPFRLKVRIHTRLIDTEEQ